MAKLRVVDAEHESTNPFLRGILTRSLQDAGLQFAEAYDLASRIRDELAESGEVDAADLRKHVAERLLAEFGDEVTERYLAPARTPATILVHSSGDVVAPFSRSLLRRHLESCGLSTDAAVATTATVFDQLVQSGVTDIRSGELGLQVFRHLDAELGPAIARRHLVWSAFLDSDRPLIVLLGGVPGSGKSTVATELAHRLEIVRTQSTDILREVMRMMIPERLLPILHVSSFTAWQAVPAGLRSPADPEALLEEGFRSQAWLLSVACEAVVRRALTERVSLVLEGVHVQPSYRDMIPDDSDAVVVSATLAVLRPKMLRKRLAGRGKRVAGRRAEKYLERFDDIWRLQSLLLSEADQHHVTIIENRVIEHVVQQIITMIVNDLERGFTATPEDVFGA